MSADALAERLKELGQMREHDLSVINLRIDDAVTASLGAARTERALLPRLHTLGGFRPELATTLEEWAYVLNHVSTQANLAPARYRLTTSLIAEAKHLRRTLSFEAHYLAVHGILSDARIATVSKSKGLHAAGKRTARRKRDRARRASVGTAGESVVLPQS